MGPPLVYGFLKLRQWMVPGVTGTVKRLRRVGAIGQRFLPIGGSLPTLAMAASTIFCIQRFPF